ncbi:MAG: hypothetical protein O3B84_01510 [Chloroflexi bacterium]|nr:hypothetical protein [Chloroflexota bacterium]
MVSVCVVALGSDQDARICSNTPASHVNGGYEIDTVSGEEAVHYWHGGQLVAVRIGTVLEYVHSDHLGSYSVTTDSTGAAPARVAYLPYGADRSTSGVLPTERCYTGQRLDTPIDLYFYNARHYDAGLGRFISPDTIVPGAGNPQAWNLLKRQRQRRRHAPRAERPDRHRCRAGE